MDFAALLAAEREAAGLPAKQSGPHRTASGGGLKRLLSGTKRPEFKREVAVESKAASAAVEFKATTAEDGAASDSKDAAAAAGSESSPESELIAYLALPLKLTAKPAAVDWKAHRVGAVDTALVCQDWISADDEKAMLALVERCPAPRWTQLKRRSLQNWGGLPKPEKTVSEPLPSWMNAIIDSLLECGVFAKQHRPNHVLLNRYAPGEGILAHKDGPLYHPRVAILSLGGDTSFRFYKQHADSHPDSHRPAFTLFLRRRSLLVFQEKLYTDYFRTLL
jgi:alkylated DNA repair protein alkB family protein 6